MEPTAADPTLLNLAKDHGRDVETLVILLPTVHLGSVQLVLRYSIDVRDGSVRNVSVDLSRIPSKAERETRNPCENCFSSSSLAHCWSRFLTPTHRIPFTCNLSIFEAESIMIQLLLGHYHVSVKVKILKLWRYYSDRGYQTWTRLMASEHV